MTENGQLVIRRVTDYGIVRHLADFLVENSDTSYISHGELQTGRAMSTREWAPDVADRLEWDFRSILMSEEGYLLVATEGETMVGLAVVEEHARRGYGVIADIVTLKSHRHRGIGERIVEWVEKDLLERNIYRIFIESGISNHVAHQFFSKKGFEPVSNVFMKQQTMDEKMTGAISKLVEYWCGIAEGISKEQTEVFRASLTRLVVDRINNHGYTGCGQLWICTDYGACETLEDAWETIPGEKKGTMISFPWKESTFIDVKKKGAYVQWAGRWKEL